MLDVMLRVVGDFGLWQFLITVIALLAKAAVAFHLLNIIAIAPPVNFICIDNEDKCAANCSKHVFDRSVFTNTIQMQWDLVCDNAALSHLSQTCAMVGTLVGNPFFGYLADKYGRRLIFLITNVLIVFFGLAEAFAPTYSLFLFFRFLASSAIGSIMVNAFVILMEIVGTKYRVAIGIIFQFLFIVGYMLIPLLSYFVRDWRYFVFITSMWSCFCLPAFWYLPESPRWLIMNGYFLETVTLLTQAAKLNKRPIDNIEEIVESAMINRDEASSAHFGYRDLFNRKQILRSLSIGFNWFMCGFCFYGMTQYASGISGNYFINITVEAALPTPGLLIIYIFLVKIGRKYSQIVSNFTGSICMFLILFVDAESRVMLVLASIGICGFYMSFSVIYIYSSELYPTITRNSAVGILSMIGRIGAIMAPLAIALQEYTYFWLPPMIFGMVGFIAALLCFCLPETLNEELPDTLYEAAQIR